MNIQPFDFQSHEVRVLVEDGEPRWVASDVAKVLGYAAAKDMTRMLDADEKGRQIVPTPGGKQEMTVITEAGLYACILKSRVPAAREFKRWVTHEVLPSIRKRGGYLTPRIDGGEITRLELIQIAMNAETERLALEAKNKELEPKADAYDSFLDATGKYPVGAVAQMLGMGQNKLFRELRNRKIFIASGSRRNTPYQPYLHHFEVIPHEYEKKNGEMGCSYTTYVQPSGIDFIRRKLNLPTIDPLLDAA
ncbi:hypothetical protein FRC0481_01301 [Corynebacterium diphtheriae]|nr:hypothetical protein FRC0481_01301 [Corynebacterium diphtheriae]CAB0969472.1 hypothetical protein FRC0480_01315 [Corynebacterium diphtheriae]